MYLSRLIIRNYRSIKEMDLEFKPGKNVIVGRNNAGKSNIVKAIDIVLGENSPTYNKSDNVTSGDFYSWKEKDENGATEVVQTAEQIEIVCQLTRGDEEELNFEEINNCFGYYKVLVSNGGYNNARGDVDKTFNFGEAYASELLNPIFLLNKDEDDRSSAGYIAAKRWIDSKLSNQRKFRDELGDKFQFMFVFRAWRDGDQIKKDIRFLCRESTEEEWVVGLTAPVRNQLLQSAIIGSFRDPQSQLRLTNYTWYGKLMRALTANHAFQPELETAHQKIREVADKIFDTARSNIQASSINVAFPNTEISFQFNEDLKADIYKDCKIYVDDGVKSPLSEKGSGIQSATIIGLFSYYVNNYCSTTGALLCVEEPELYLHPHARRVISDRLDEFLDEGKNQVIITTHSSEFIKTTQDDLNIVLVKFEERKTKAKSVDVRKYKSLLLNGNQNELFFADKVIVCEGYDDFILRWIAKEKFPEKIDGGNISIITAGGKDNISRLAELILNLGIKCFVFADFDFFLRDNSADADKFKDEIKDSGSGKVLRTKSYRHQSVSDLPESFFKQTCILGHQSEVYISRIKELRAILKKANEAFFYTGKILKDAPVNIEDIKNLLNELRARGLCILEGEIENLSKDQTFMSPHNKMSLNKVFEISTRLEDNSDSITDIFETDQFEVFLRHVLEI